MWFNCEANIIIFTQIFFAPLIAWAYTDGRSVNKVFNCTIFPQNFKIGKWKIVRIWICTRWVGTLLISLHWQFYSYGILGQNSALMREFSFTMCWACYSQCQLQAKKKTILLGATNQQEITANRELNS